MITPKEKAKELFDKYCLALKTEGDEFGYWTNIIQAKQCAKIAIYEILQAYKHCNSLTTEVCSTLLFYNEVKKEIEKL